MKLGELDITPLSDGYFRMPPDYFGQADWGAHQALAGPDGNIEIPVGCFLVRTGGKNVLIDAGLGPIPHTEQFGGGALPGELEKAGVKPEDIDILICTHLHFDHIGWSVQNGSHYFPNASVYFGKEDFEHFYSTETPDAFAQPVVKALEDAGKINLIDSDADIAPGISTLHTPGHTPGHRSVVLSSGDERIYLLGDAMTCPFQLSETDWQAMSDVDPKLSARTREAFLKEIESNGAQMVGAHFPGLQFGRVLQGEGKRYFS